MEKRLIKVYFWSGIINWIILIFGVAFMLFVFSLPSKINPLLNTVLSVVYIISSILILLSGILAIVGVVFAIIYYKNKKIETKNFIISLGLNLTYLIVYGFGIRILFLVGSGI